MFTFRNTSNKYVFCEKVLHVVDLFKSYLFRNTNAHVLNKADGNLYVSRNY